MICDWQYYSDLRIGRLRSNRIRIESKEMYGTTDLSFQSSNTLNNTGVLIELASLYTVRLSAVNGLSRLTTTSNGDARPIREFAWLSNRTNQNGRFEPNRILKLRRSLSIIELRWNNIALSKTLCWVYQAACALITCTASRSWNLTPTSPYKSRWVRPIQYTTRCWTEHVVCEILLHKFQPSSFLEHSVYIVFHMAYFRQYAVSQS